MNYVSSTILILSVWAHTAYAQRDSLTAEDRPQRNVHVFNAPYSKFILPGALITYGALTQVIHPLRQFDETINEGVHNRRIRVDDYLQYAPAAAVYGLDFAGIRAKHNFRERTFVMASSHLLMAVSVLSVKHSAGVVRPDGSAANSFPSGHTAIAFTGAHILFREYKDASPWIGVAGYATATATGVMRILNRRHWLSDVAAGAGLGILCAEAGYLLLPVFRRVTGEGGPELVIAPVLGNKTYGLGFACQF
ncbi:MAG: phosphatase PAP2 family protein [Tannerellaceae bacterium]|jgi:membrane-associated phospholipid phosphatase|nr:phosphatase PAP2 family protein [Tannerellaceae bacterium]